MGDTTNDTVEKKTWLQGTDPEIDDWEECGTYAQFLTDKRQIHNGIKWYKLCPEGKPVEMRVERFKKYIKEAERLKKFAESKKIKIRSPKTSRRTRTFATTK